MHVSVASNNRINSPGSRSGIPADTRNGDQQSEENGIGLGFTARSLVWRPETYIAVEGDEGHGRSQVWQFTCAFDSISVFWVVEAPDETCSLRNDESS